MPRPLAYFPAGVSKRIDGRGAVWRQCKVGLVGVCMYVCDGKLLPLPPPLSLSVSLSQLRYHMVRYGTGRDEVICGVRARPFVVHVSFRYASRGAAIPSGTCQYDKS